MDWKSAGGPAVGLLIATVTVTAPVGVSGAVFFLPAQLSVLGVPNSAITPTNLLFNAVAGPGALWRYRHDGALRGDLPRRPVLGTLPPCCRSACGCACAPSPRHTTARRPKASCPHAHSPASPSRSEWGYAVSVSPMSNSGSCTTRGGRCILTCIAGLPRPICSSVTPNGASASRVRGWMANARDSRTRSTERNLPAGVGHGRHAGRYHERFADHAVSVARRLVHLVTGAHADELAAGQPVTA
ncbi:hypothetical protein [Streptomyces sp. NPDC001401]|uniref:hypothetical protein n=1 Tax=Streptomyces sp. NPDC001401 TaxID=3364570 RepID=UPI003675E792